MSNVLPNDPPQSLPGRPNLTIVGIDPGSVSGALAVLRQQGQSSAGEVWDIPHVERQLDGHWLYLKLVELEPDAVVIEQVHSMPKQGVTSTFNFGVSYGIILGVVAALALPHWRAQPAVWKKHFSLSGKDNEACRSAAIRRLPLLAPHLILKKHHNRASALLIAQWFLDTQRVWTA